MLRLAIVRPVLAVLAGLLAAGVGSALVASCHGREGRSFRVLWRSTPCNDLALMASPRVPAAHAPATVR
jgi:phosphonate transport system substrate-binding protein